MFESSFGWPASDRLMTNFERCRCHLSNSATCPLWSREEETILHVLRDCNLSKDL